MDDADLAHASGSPPPGAPPRPAARQTALNLIWGKLLLVFIVLSAAGVVAAYQESIMRVPALVCIFGNLGAYVSMHRSLSTLSDEELANFSTSWLGLIVPSFVGGILSLVLYILFLSGLVAGDIFPAFSADNKTSLSADTNGFSIVTAQHANSMSDYAKLLFWSFIGGFNQKYAIDIIESVKMR